MVPPLSWSSRLGDPGMNGNERFGIAPVFQPTPEPRDADLINLLITRNGTLTLVSVPDLPIVFSLYRPGHAGVQRGNGHCPLLT